MSRSGGGVGLANATNTNTDTSARVHTTARVCIHLYNSLADPNVIQSNSAEFKAIKEEIALGLGRSFNALGLSYADQRGLAPVITNTAVINSGKPDDLMRWYLRLYDCRTVEERITLCKQPCVVKGQGYYPSDLYFAGLVMSEGEADPTYGDTAITLMIGGKVTVRNGHYPMQTGDRVQWYFEEEVEAEMFDSNGLRTKRRGGGGAIEYTAPIPQQQQKIRDHTYAERALLKRPAFIKSYLEGLDGKGATRGDKARIIGMACSNAGPYERVDIKICRQSF